MKRAPSRDRHRPRRRASRAAQSAILIGGLLTGPLAGAPLAAVGAPETADRIRALNDAAQAAIKSGDYATALGAYRDAIAALRGEPDAAVERSTAMFLAAVCLEKLDRPAEAIIAHRDALAAGLAEPLASKARARIPTLAAAAAAAPNPAAAAPAAPGGPIAATGSAEAEHAPPTAERPPEASAAVVGPAVPAAAPDPAMPAPRQPARAQTAKTQPAKTQPAKTQTAKTQTAKTQTAKTQTPKTQTPKTQTPKTQAAKTQTAKTQPARTQPARTQPAKTQPAEPSTSSEAALAAINARAKAAVAASRWDDALAAYHEAVARLSDMPARRGELAMTWFLVGVCLDELGRRDEADPAYARARALGPSPAVLARIDERIGPPADAAPGVPVVLACTPSDLAITVGDLLDGASCDALRGLPPGSWRIEGRRGDGPTGARTVQITAGTGAHHISLVVPPRLDLPPPEIDRRAAWVLTLGAAVTLGAGGALMALDDPDDLGPEARPVGIGLLALGGALGIGAIYAFAAADSPRVIARPPGWGPVGWRF